MDKKLINIIFEKYQRKFDIIKFMYGHGFFLKLNFIHFQRYTLTIN